MSYIAHMKRSNGKEQPVEVLRRVCDQYYLVRDGTGRPDRLVSYHRLRVGNRQLPGPKEVA